MKQSDKNIQNCHILCGTPNRIINMLDAKELDLSKCQMIVLDECDKITPIESATLTPPGEESTPLIALTVKKWSGKNMSNLIICR